MNHIRHIPFKMPHVSGFLALLLAGVLAGPSVRAELAPVHVSGRDLVANGQPLRLRGLDWGWWHLSGTHYTEADMRRQAEWGANVARLAFSYGDLEDKAHPGTWREDGFAQFDEVLQWAKKYNQYVILDMHVAPGGQDPATYCDGGQNRLWKDAACQKRTIDLWCEIARRCRNRPEVAAYELLNEPVTQRPNPELLTNLCQRLIAAIRQIDPNKVIVMPGDQWSNPRDLKDAIKLADTNILYTFHFYEGGYADNWLRNVNDVKGDQGTRDWTHVDIPVKITDEVTQLSVLLRSNMNSGTAWFDDIKLLDGAGNVVQSHTFDKDAAPYRVEREPRDVGAYDPGVGHDKPGSLRISKTTAVPYAGWTSPRWRVWPGQTYHITGWIKLENATGGSFVAAALFGVNAAQIDTADIRRRLAPAVDFGKKYNVPLWVGEFAAARNAGPEGYQVNSVEARIALMEEFGISWTYWNYRETTGPDGMALQAQKRDGSGDYPINEPLLALLKEAWGLNAKPLPAGATFRHTRRAVAGVPDGYYPFVIPWDDATPGVATDVSFLNTKPAGANGRIVVRDGHFFEEHSGQRVRFVGVNGMTFPSHADAEKLAAHLAKAGVNLARLHNMDNKGNWGVKATVFDHTYPDTQHYQADVLDNFHYSIAQLKKNGIYVTFEVQVNRQLKAGDGIGENPLLGKAMKRYDRFDRVWIELDKKYAHDLLTSVNPYTGMALKDDPVLATVEINNENSLYQNVYGLPAPESVPEPYRSELNKLWNGWLRKRYPDEQAMLAAWNQGAGLGASLLAPTNAWTSESHPKTTLDVLPLPDVATVSDGAPPAVFKITASKGATAWHAQAHLIGLTLAHGETYTISFRMKSDHPRAANIRVCRDLPNWENFGLNRDFETTAEWKDYAFTFTAHKPLSEHVRISLILGGESASYSIDGLKLRRGYPPETLAAGQSLAAANIGSGWGTPARNLDWRRLLADLDRTFADELRAFLVKDVGVRAPIVDTQIDYGKLEGPYREENMDYADVHGYWQHPAFPGRPWDFGNWNIDNSAQIHALRSGDDGVNGSMLQKLASSRVAGKPYIVSEFDHPAPSDFAAEMLPSMATFAALQDWDGFDLFALGGIGPFDGSRIDLWFDALGHPGKFGFLPQAALIFRTGAFAPAVQAATLTIPRDIWLDDNLNFADAWKAAAQDGRIPDMLTTRLGVASTFAGAGTKPTLAADAGKPVDSAIALQQSAAGVAGDIYLAHSPACAVLIGNLEGKSASAGALTLTDVRTDGGFIAASLVATDAKPIAGANRLLLSIAGRFANVGMKWDQERKSVGQNWGKGPSIAAGIRADVSIETDGPRQVYALSPVGDRREEVPARFKDGTLRFQVSPEYQTIWYDITK